MVRAWLFSLLLAPAIGVIPVPILAQDFGDPSDIPGPRFFLASAQHAKPVRIDLTRSALLRQPLALSFEGTPLKEALAEISRQAGLSLVYADDAVPITMPVSLRAERISVAAALTDILLNTGVDIVFTPDGRATLVKRPAGPLLQQGSISGTVTALDAGTPLPGATISVVGMRLSAQTDDQGRFTIAAVPVGTQRLHVRLVGYAPKDTTVEVAEAQETAVNLQLRAQAFELEAVVAVGYATQTKATLTGAVSAVTGEEVADAPVVNLSNTLTGKLPGVITLNASGEPGYDGATIRVRGVHTLQSDEEGAPDANQALVVIDGVPDRSGGLERLDPRDIQSISVLKDATAAIYGARAANGVILITTKRGQSAQPQITVSFNQGFNQPTRIPKLADAATYMTMLNEVDMYSNRSPRYSPEEIQSYRDGTDPWLYPNTDWFAATFKPLSMQRNGHVAISGGGGEKLGYYVSLNGLTEDGYYRNSATGYQQYGFRSNIDGRVSDNLNVRFDVSGRLEDRNFPNRSAGSIFWMLMRGKPNEPAYWPNGLPGPDIEYGDNPVVITTNATGYDRDQRYYLQGNLGLDWTVPWARGLTIRASASYDQDFRTRKQWRKPWTLYIWDRTTRDTNGEPMLEASERGFSEPQIVEDNWRNNDILLNLVANYRREIGPHAIGVLGGVERQTTNWDSLGAFRRDFLSEQIDQISAGGNIEKNNWGSAGIGARVNYFTRISYAFQNKYLVDFVGRVDGSYIFPQGKRYGFFPAISAGWRISEEPFFRDRISLFDDLKLRASWGRSGNDRIEPWQYLPTYEFGDGYVFGVDQEMKSIYQSRIANPLVTWEVANQFDVGLEGTLLDNRLSFVFDYFRERRHNVLWWRNASVPQTTGFSLPRENIGRISSWGYDGSITWRERLASGFSYDATLIFGHAQNRIDFWDEAPGAPVWQYSTGCRMNSDLYYRAIGVFRDSAALNAYPHVDGARPGDIIFADVDENGTINANDRVRICKNGDPTFTGGLKLGGRFRNFDLMVFFQGAAGAVQYVRTQSGEIGNYFQEFAEQRWTPDNPNGEHPRAFNRQEEYWISNDNTYFLRDANYIRLKTLEIGYQLPPSLAQRFGTQQLRVYASGFNLLTWDSFKLMDPEARSENGAYYPQQRVFNFGASITF